MNFHSPANHKEHKEHSVKLVYFIWAIYSNQNLIPEFLDTEPQQSFPGSALIYTRIIYISANHTFCRCT